MATYGNILAPLDAEHLRDRGHVRTYLNGTMKLHRRRLNRSSDQQNPNVSLKTTIYSPTPAPLEAFSTIPSRLISRATIEYMGFSANGATAIWKSWSEFPQLVDCDGDGAIISFIDFMTGPFDSRGDNVDDGDDGQWRRTMDGFGLSTALQDSIMHPAFRELRLTKSCAYWCKDTVEMRYEALRYIQQSSMERQRAIERDRGYGCALYGGSRQCQAGIPIPFLGSWTGPPLAAYAQGGQRQRQRRQQQQQKQQSQDRRPASAAPVPASIFDDFETVADMAAVGIDGHTVLFKAIDEARTDGFLDAQGCIQDMGAILSSTPSEFDSDRAMFYFTPDLATARYYAAYAKLRGTSETNIVVICLAIPNQVLQRLTGDALQYLYWPNEVWKEYVRHNHARKTMPFALRRFRRAMLLIGSTSKKNNFAWRQLTGPGDVTQDFVLMMDGRPAIQYCFDGSDECQDFLKENIAPRPYVYHFTQDEWNAWREEYCARA